MTLYPARVTLFLILNLIRNVPGYVCNPGSPRERDAASQGHTSGIPTRALLHSWKLAPAALHVLLSILVVTSPAPDVWLSILTDYTYDSELDIADGVPLAFDAASRSLGEPGLHT